jgi:hypothetical protein
MNTAQRNHLASILYCDMLKGDDFDTCESAAKDCLYAADVFIEQASIYDERKNEACQCSASETAPEQRSGNERRSNVDRRGVQEKKGEAQTSAEEDEAFRQLEQALKDQFLMATLNNIFRNAAARG